MAADSETLRQVIVAARGAGVPFVVLGRGSNILVDDDGFDGVVILNRSARLTIDQTEVAAASGVLLSVLARSTIKAGLRGLEWCHDIPGTVGGAVVSNAGANGGDIATSLRYASLLGEDDRVRERGADALAFTYRGSALRVDRAVPAAGRAVVLEARFALQPAPAAELEREMAAYRRRRKATQPGGSSAGSVFKNPDGDSAGRLVDSVGLKGFRHGGASISALHGNFIVTEPGATAADVLALIRAMRRRVAMATGIHLEPEVQFLRRDGRIGPPPPEDE